MNLYLSESARTFAQGVALLQSVGIVSVEQPADAITVEAQPRDSGLTVTLQGSTATIGYSRPVEFFRGLSLVKEAVSRGETTLCVQQTASFESNGFMLDCSRNAAPKLTTIRDTLAMMALMGLNTMQLYTEDMYALEEYPYFGYMRGRYTDEELKQVDDMAYSLGIEVIPCIQTLAHLATALRWGCFSDMVDCNDILMAGEDSTYHLVTAMIAKMRRCFRSRHINIGMDEAGMIGLGKYMKKNGIRPRVDIMCEHIARVKQICDEYAFTPMMWSDMFFHLAGGNYDDAGIPAEVVEKVPEGVMLVYWEYYNTDQQHYGEVIAKHLQFRNPIGFAGCAWKWNGLLPELRHSLRVSRMALSECLSHGVQTVMATAWGDDGAECPLFTVLPVLQFYAEFDYTGGAIDDETLAQRFAACTGGVLEDFLLLDKPNRTTEHQPAIGLNPTKYLLYQDVLEGLFDKHVDPATFPGFFAGCARELHQAALRAGRFAYLFEYEAAVCETLAVKCTAGVNIRAAYERGDRALLEQYVEQVLPDILNRVQHLIEVWYAQWVKENKVYGFDTLDIRLGGLCARIRTAQRRLAAYLAGELDTLEELCEPRLYFDCRTDEQADVNTFCNTWTHIATPSVI